MTGQEDAYEQLSQGRLHTAGRSGLRKYTEIRELSAEIIREFAERIYVHKAEQVDGKPVMRIRSVWNCIGELPGLPTAEQGETA